MRGKERMLIFFCSFSSHLISKKKFIYSNVFTYSFIIETYSNYIFRVFSFQLCSIWLGRRTGCILYYMLYKCVSVGNNGKKEWKRLLWRQSAIEWGKDTFYPSIRILIHFCTLFIFIPCALRSVNYAWEFFLKFFVFC